MEDFSFEAVAKKSVRGVFALVSRTFLIQLLSVVASFILTVYLSPDNFGVFFVVSSIVVFFNYFQDIGLAASLIQKKEKPNILELRTAFTVQQALVLFLIIPAFIFSGKITSFYNLSADAHLLFIALLISFFLSSLRTIPTVLLERDLEFKKLVIPQIGENIIYNVSLIAFAVSGFGLHSFTIAILARGVVGLVLTYIIKPWMPGIMFDKASFKRMISFGLPFQTNNILALVKDDLLIIYIGKILPFAQVGYIGFAQKWAFLPLRLVMDNVIKITFPSYSRLQHDKEALKIAVEKSLFLISIFIFPTAVGFITLSPYLIEFIPRYGKWEPALVSLAFFALSTIFSSISTPLTNFLNAIGKVKTTLYFMLGWTGLTWILTPLFIRSFGYNGFAFASFLISISSVFVFVVTRRYVEFSFIRPVFRQLIASVGMFLFIQVTQFIATSLTMLFAEIALAGLFYLSLLYILAKDELTKTTKFILANIRAEKT